MSQWWEHLPSTKVARVQFRPGAICVSGLSLVLALLRGFFLRLLQFSSLHKNEHLEIPVDQDRGPAWKPAKAVDVASSLNSET